MNSRNNDIGKFGVDLKMPEKLVDQVLYLIPVLTLVDLQRLIYFSEEELILREDQDDYSRTE
jgi:hypothetical protein